MIARALKDCLFCKIMDGKIPSEKVYENDQIYAFKDIHPKAPVHVLIVPRIHIDSLAEINENNVEVLNPLFLAANTIAKKLGISERGYRTVFNCRQEGGQAVYHLHLHLLGGHQLGGDMAG